MRAIEAPEGAGEAFNIAREAGTQRSFVEALARVAGVQPRFVAIPRAAIHAAGVGNLYFGQYLDIPPISEKNGLPFFYQSISLLSASLAGASFGARLTGGDPCAA